MSGPLILPEMQNVRNKEEKNNKEERHSQSHDPYIREGRGQELKLYSTHIHVHTNLRGGC